MRSPIWFVVAAAIAVAGFAGAVLYLMPRLAAADARMMRVVVPGNAMLVFDKPGPYMIYHEKKSTVDGRYYASDNVDGLSLGLTADATGAQVKLVEPKTNTSYTIGNRSGTSIYASRSTSPAATGWRRTWRAAVATPRPCWRSTKACSAPCWARSSAPSPLPLPVWAWPAPSCLQFCGSARKRPSRWRQADCEARIGGRQ